MKAINLIPSDQRRGAGGAAGRTGGLSYALIGVLALALIMFAAWTQTNTSIDEKTAEASSLEETAAIRTAQASALGPYAKFAELRTNRVQTIKQLADSRFDWAHAMGELSRTLPADTWLSAMTGTVAPGVGGDVGGASDPLRTARAVPALELSGCATSQTAVTTFLARLKLMNGVDRVDLSSSKKSESSGATGAVGPTDSASGSAGTVRDNPCAKPGRPAFSVVVFYEGLINPPGKTGAPTLNKQAPVAPAAPGAAPATTTPAAGAPTSTTTTSQTAPAAPGAAK